MQSRDEWKVLAALSIALVLYQNIMAVLTHGELFASGAFGFVATGVLVTALLVHVRVSQIGLGELGITKQNLRFAIEAGVLVALAVGGLVLGLLTWGPLVGGGVRYMPLSTMPWATVLSRALIWIPLTTALPEELAFRGVLLARLNRRLPASTAALASAIPFTLWHAVVVFHTVGQASLAHSIAGSTLGCCAGFAAVFIGGVLFARLRLATGNLAASLVAHWGFNTAILIGLYLMR